MALPLTPPVQPMLANTADTIPTDSDLLFEPKFDGYRVLVFRDGDEVFLQSRSGKPLNRYFPEAEAALRRTLPPRVVLDGELVVAKDGKLDFDALSERIHPAASRIALLSERTPAGFVAFDLLALGDDVLLEEPTTARRARLEALVTPGDGLYLTPATADASLAGQWFELFEGAGLDGVIGKPAGAAYEPGKRVMVKVKHQRTADCVVAGLRWHKDTDPGTAVGSLLLGLHDERGVLHHVGVVGSFKAAERRELAEEFAPLITSGDHPWLVEPDGRRLPGEINRWRGKHAEWVPLRPERVLEIAYSQTEGAAPARLRHNGQFRRWRPDRDPASCGYDQLEQPARYDVESVLRGEVRPA
ncbi:ATP-dependent DNA ligase [Saccharothrix longispora]|uniref:ATP-dependent DNA ligase n=1 Tax=Saccharothrix longispora TaxID=33920 RepID=UPI0028FD59C9|nr:ATP-dependent DNA ligase [Saccharothrix longispora]MBY8848932.1 ATP-dependent DNA ligase [Saccharothrix sp. MB29]MDU0293793.1 ATP-dependent DNA ligase [Saccharothrix longispora]